MPQPQTSLTSSRSKGNTKTSLVSDIPDAAKVSASYNDPPALPWVSGAEFAGVVLATPANLSKPQFPVGSRVFGASQGAYAAKVLAKEATILPVPEGWSFQDAAGLFVTAPTSYGALVHRAHVKAGDYVLVHAAAGGVGLAAVQGAFQSTTFRLLIC